ncbi:putative Lysophospholipase [Candidatus Terasakiella magnetica]|uniref:Putative Lysophospholipase n=1 Tax=Candidatus Terasakiella magnetica TaxID=1867952 RepID=A0A1C3RHL6_9PROT|nr:OmpA family protein [Candidatus Terasakiella magnetica]SCA56769.1 putative Lysophospholipase [Candidatus Terasakiella magnetica]
MGKLAGFRKVLMSTSVGVGLVIAASAQAQTAMNYDNNVMVDLSVLEDNGVNPSRRAAPSSSPFSYAKMPPAAMPRSTLHGLPRSMGQAAPAMDEHRYAPQGVPKSRLVLRKPDVQPAARPTLPSERNKSLVLTKPAPAPTKPVERKVEVAKAAPKPMVKVEPKPVVVEKPAVVAPSPAPEPVKEVVKVEPPKPVAAPATPVEVTKAEPVMPAAPKVMEKKAEAPAVPEPAPAPATVMAEAPPPPPPSAVEPKKVESKMKAAPKPTATAALPPKSESSVRVSFQSGQSKLPASAQSNLKEMAATLSKNPDDRVQLLAYAGGEELSASKARRLSLSRALAVRSYLINQGVRSTRIDVRALGNKTTEEPFDRVDVQLTPR